MGSGEREAGSGKREAGSGEQEAGSRKQEAGSRKQEAGSRKRGAGSRKREAGSGKREAGSGERGAGSGERGAGSRKQEAGSRKRGAGSGERGAGSGERGAGSGEREAGSGKTYSPPCSLLVTTNQLDPNHDIFQNQMVSAKRLPSIAVPERIFEQMSLPFSLIEAIVGSENLLRSPEELHCYSFDASKMCSAPEGVVFPSDAAQISALVKLANEQLFALYPRGSGSGMVGACLPRGGLVVVTNRLNKILEIDGDNMTATVEPGVITGEFQKAVSKYGLFYPPDPASLAFSSMGGNVAMCSGGPRAVKYGVTRDYLLGLEMVLPTSEIIRTGTRTMKGVVGYDMTRLMAGSEGTLGIFTKILVRLIPAPQSVRTLTTVFSRLESAIEAICSILKARITPSTIELMDQATIGAIENHLHIGLPVEAEAIVLIEVDGYDIVLDGEVSEIEKICRNAGATSTEVARSPEQRERLWRARRSISPALGRIRPGKLNEDVTVPRTKIPELIRSIRSLARKHDLIIVCFGHAGDGNIHTNIMFDRKNESERRRAGKAVEELFTLVLGLGGTISGEHGIGIAKSPFIEQEVGPGGLEAMRRIKKALDPLNILNPGKMFVADRTFLDFV
ncbi:MAG: FAD-linked oxidase C-terminal domain-containing protein [Syntrophobacteraceae bacterium]|nr:FAD-linked oxidase C-terminal domain-containing protein [Syntrophobacteraceae bacterium]